MTLPVLPSDSSFRRFTFGAFEVDARTRELKREGSPVRLADQSVLVLLALLERAGEVVTREELRDRLWAANTFVDFEHGLNSAVRRLRHALGDSADNPTLIETLPRRGYRFVGAVSAKPAPTTLSGTRETVLDGRQSLDVDASTPADSPSLSTPLLIQRPRAISAVALAVALVGLAGIVISRLGTSKVLDHLQWSTGPVRLTFEDGLQTDPSLSPDGQQVAYAADLAGNFDIWTRRIAGGRPVRVTTDLADDWQPDWSPDGNAIAFRSERGTGGIFVTPATGGPEQKVADFGFRPLWSPDGKWILFARSILAAATPGLQVVGLDGRAPRRLASPPGAFGWEPNSHNVFVLTSLNGPFVPHAMSIDVDTGERRSWSVDTKVDRQFTERRLSVPGGEALHWSADGASVFFIGDVQGFRCIWQLDIERASRRIVRGPFPVTTQPDAVHFSLSSDARRIVFDGSSRVARIWSYAFHDAEGIERRSGTALTAEATHVNKLDLSRDGKRLLFLVARPSSRERRELVTRDLETGHEQTVRVVDDDRETLLVPRWSTDGQRVSYTLITGTAQGTAEQRVVILDPAIDREAPLTSASSPDTLELAWSWTPDDQFIVSSGTRYVPGRTAVALLPLSAAPAAEKQARIVTTAKDVEFSQVSMSPDRRWIVFHVRDLQDAELGYLSVVSAEGGDQSQWHVVTNRDLNADKPRWSATGNALYFTVDNGAGINLWRVGFDSGQGRPVGSPRQLTKFAGPAVQIAPDIRLLELGIAGGRAVLPLEHARGALWMTERLSNVAAR